MKIKITLLYNLLLLLTGMNLQAQNPDVEWTTVMGGPSFDYVQSITTDASGNVYTTGQFLDTVDFDLGVGIANLISNRSGAMFVQKLDANGALIWAKQMVGNNDVYANSIVTDRSENIYTIGQFYGTIDFDPGVGTTNLTSISSTDIFIQKLDSDGNLIWVNQIEESGTGSDRGHSIIIDISGNICATGYFSGTADFDPGVGITNLTSNGQSDIFIQKLDTDGNLLWVKQIGGTSNDYGESITTDMIGNVYTTGKFYGTVDFDPGIGITSLTSNGGHDAFIQKLDTDGRLLWVKKIGGTSSRTDLVEAITTDGSGNVYTTGYFWDTKDFDPGIGVTNLISNETEGAEIFIQKLDPDGDLLWAKQMGGNSGDGGRGITIDPSGNLYTTGFFHNTVNFNPAGGTIELTSNGSVDIYIQKMRSCSSNTGIDVITACDKYTWINGITYTQNNNTSTYTLTNKAGCDSVITLNLRIYSVSDLTTTLTGATIIANSATSIYQWLNCDDNFSIIDGETNRDFTTSVSGNYAVELTENGCVDTSACVPISITGIDELSWTIDITAYPNPTQGSVNIQFEKSIENIQLIITDIQGEIISDKQYENITYTTTELGKVPGIYFLTLKTEFGIKTIQIVKK